MTILLPIALDDWACSAWQWPVQVNSFRVSNIPTFQVFGTKTALLGNGLKKLFWFDFNTLSVNWSHENGLFFFKAVCEYSVVCHASVRVQANCDISKQNFHLHYSLVKLTRDMYIPPYILRNCIRYIGKFLQSLFEHVTTQLHVILKFSI